MGFHTRGIWVLHPAKASNLDRRLSSEPKNRRNNYWHANKHARVRGAATRLRGRMTGPKSTRTVPAGAPAPFSASTRWAVTWLEANVAACLPPCPSKTPNSPTRTSPAGRQHSSWARGSGDGSSMQHVARQLQRGLRAVVTRTLSGGHGLGGGGGFLKPGVFSLVHILAQTEPHVWLGHALRGAVRCHAADLTCAARHGVTVNNDCRRIVAGSCHMAAVMSSASAKMSPGHGAGLITATNAGQVIKVNTAHGRGRSWRTCRGHSRRPRWSAPDGWGNRAARRAVASAMDCRRFAELYAPLVAPGDSGVREGMGPGTS